MFELGLRTTLNEITLGLHVHVFLEAFMVWLSKIVSTDNSTTNRFKFLPASKYKNNSHSCKEKEATCPCGRASESASDLGPERRDQDPLRQPFHLL